MVEKKTFNEVIETCTYVFDPKQKTELDKDTRNVILSYLKNDEHRKYLMRVLGTHEKYYYDDAFYWSDDRFAQFANGEIDVVDGFVDHVLRRLKEDGEG